MRTAVIPVRIYDLTRKRLDRVIERLAKIGWASIDVPRDHAPGIANVIDEALIDFEAKVEAAAKKRGSK